jgi:cytochrome c553
MKLLRRRILQGFVAVPIVLAIFVAARSEWLLHKSHVLSEPAIAIATDAAAPARGQHIAITRGCTDCHGQDLGGRVVIDSPALGTLSATNLTRGSGGVGARLDARDWERAIRHGVGRNGRTLLFMPVGDFVHTTDADLGDLIAFLQSVAPVDRTNAPSSLGPLGRALLAFGLAPLTSVQEGAQHPANAVSVAKGPDAKYGHYLAQVCTYCHGPQFSGGRIPGAPPDVPAAANLTSGPGGLGDWSRADFSRAMREGIRPDGKPLNNFMPSRSFAEFDDIEVDALWAFLQTLPPRAAGSR